MHVYIFKKEEEGIQHIRLIREQAVDTYVERRLCFCSKVWHAFNFHVDRSMGQIDR